jgi:anion-transporting  ArsA/GET3 family ATPase
VGPEIRQLEENLWAVDVRPQEAMREYALMVLKFKTVYKAVFENRVVRYFLRFIPSLQELVMLGKILYHVQERRPDGGWRYDCIVMDAPATGHALSFLSVPQVLLDTVPPGAMANEARKMRDLLVDPAVTQAVLVSLPEEMPIVETLELAQGLREKVRVHTAAAVLNAFISERFTPDDVAALPPPLRPPARAHLERSRLSVQSRERLERGLSVPVYPVPRLFPEQSFGRKAIEEVARHLRPLVEGTR